MRWTVGAASDASPYLTLPHTEHSASHTISPLIRVEAPRQTSSLHTSTLPILYLSPLRVEAPRQTSSRRHFDQIKTVAKVNPKIIASLQELCRVGMDSVKVWVVWKDQG